MKRDPIRYTRRGELSTTVILVRLRRESLSRRDCRLDFDDLPRTFVALVENLAGQDADFSICPVFLEARFLLDREGGIFNRLRKGVMEYMPPEAFRRQPGRHTDCDGDRLNMLTYFRLRFSHPAQAAAAFEQLKKEPSVLVAEWAPLRYIVEPALRKRTAATAAPAARREAPLGREAEGFLEKLTEIQELLAELKQCGCAKPKKPGIPDDSYKDWGLEAVEAPRDPDLGQGITIAVVDLGTDGTHPDLAGRVEFGLATPPGLVNDAGNRYPLDPTKPRGHHGTAVSGIIAGARHGVLPKARIVSFQVSADQPFEGTDAFGQTIRYYPVDPVLFASALAELASEQWRDVTVMNMSLGGQAPLSQSEEASLAAVAGRGILMIASSGNHSRPGDYAGVMYPARDPRVLSVGAVGIENTTGYYKHADFSNFESNDYLINVMGPGVGIHKCVPRWIDAEGYGWGDGTSYASPFVAGIAGYSIRKKGTYEPKDHATRLKYQAAGRDFDERHGWGLAKWPE